MVSHQTTHDSPHVPPHVPAKGPTGLARIAGRWIRHICWSLAILLALLMMTQILLRTFTTLPSSWTDELLKLTFTWFGLLAAVQGFWDGGHIAIDFFVKLFPARTRRLIVLSEHFLTAGLLILLLPYFWDLVLTARGQHTITLGIPMAASYLAFPVCFALMAIDRVAALYRLIRQGGAS